MINVSTYKIVTFVATNHLDELVDALREEYVNRIGEYANCMSWAPVSSTWTPLEGAKPFIGKPGEVVVEDEYRLEMLCAQKDLRRVVEAIRRAHPYEEPEIDIYPLIAADDGV